MNFFALDVETSNSDRGSICQIGWVEFEDELSSISLEVFSFLWQLKSGSKFGSWGVFYPYLRCARTISLTSQPLDGKELNLLWLPPQVAY